jgi:hypothetical protein
MKAHKEWRYGSTFLDLGNRRGKWLTSRPGRFTPRERAPVPVDKRLDGPHSRSGRWSGEISYTPFGN